MLKGKITDDLEPIVDIELIFQKEKILQIAVIDTGFNGSLSIPSKLIHESGWQFIGFERYEIADGKILEANVYLGKVIFDGSEHEVECIASHSKEILLGTKLLKNKVLFVNFKTKSLYIK